MTPDTAQNIAIILLGLAILVDGWAFTRLRRDLTRIRFDRQDVREMVRGEVERVHAGHLSGKGTSE